MQSPKEAACFQIDRRMGHDAFLLSLKLLAEEVINLERIQVVEPTGN